MLFCCANRLYGSTQQGPVFTRYAPVLAVKPQQQGLGSPVGMTRAVGVHLIHVGAQPLPVGHQPQALSGVFKEVQPRARGVHRNGVAPSGIYTVDATLNEQQYKSLKKWIDENYAGPSNRSSAMILDRGAKFVPLSQTGVDAQHIETRRFQIEEICRAFGVYPAMVGHSDKASTYASAEQMFLSHVVHCLAPWAERIEQALECQLLTRQERRAGYYIKHNLTSLLRGATKEKESLPQMLRGLSKLRNLGQGYVNFGEPLPLMTYLNHHVPEWREAIDPIEAVRPSWLTPTVNNIAADLMVRINNAGAANAMNLCCTALLASRQRSLTREQLTQQLECYLALLRNVPYSPDATAPSASASELIDHALQMNKFEVEKDTIGDIIILPREQAVLMTYYRNNIAHMLVMPSLLAALVTQHRHLSRAEVLRHVETLYPFLKAELFLRWEKAELAGVMDALIAEMLRQELIVIDGDVMSLNPSHSRSLQLLAAGARETLQRYAITFWLLSANPSINRSSLEKESRTVAQRLSVLHGINAPEFFDKAVFSTLVLTLRDEGYISDTGDAEPEETLKVYRMLADLITSDVRLTIESVTQDDA